MSKISFEYRDGQLDGVTMYDPELAGAMAVVNRSNPNDEPFISIRISDANVDFVAYLPAEIAAKLLDGLKIALDKMPHEAPQQESPTWLAHS